MEWIQFITAVVVIVVANILTERWKNRNSNIQALTDKISDLTDAFNAFVSDFMSNTGDMKPPSDYLVKSSPVELSERGEKLAEVSGITKYADNIFNKYYKKLSQHKDGITLFNACREIATKELETNAAVEIRKHFYKEGHSQLLMKEIFAIVLRVKVEEEINKD